MWAPQFSQSVGWLVCSPLVKHEVITFRKVCEATQAFCRLNVKGSLLKQQCLSEYGLLTTDALPCPKFRLSVSLFFGICYLYPFARDTPEFLAETSVWKSFFASGIRKQMRWKGIVFFGEKSSQTFASTGKVIPIVWNKARDVILGKPIAARRFDWKESVPLTKISETSVPVGNTCSNTDQFVWWHATEVWLKKAIKLNGMETFCLGLWSGASVLLSSIYHCIW